MSEQGAAEAAPTAKEQALALTPEAWEHFVAHNQVPIRGNGRSLKFGALAKAMAAAQGEIKIALKDRTVEVQTKTGGKYSYVYADLAQVYEACREPLSKHGIAVFQVPTRGQSGVAVTTLLLHESEQWVQGELVLPGDTSDPKAIGSLITYARRYGLSAMVGVVTSDEDDDAEAGAQATKPKDKPKKEEHPALARRNAENPAAAPPPAGNAKEAKPAGKAAAAQTAAKGSSPPASGSPKVDPAKAQLWQAVVRLDGVRGEDGTVDPAATTEVANRRLTSWGLPGLAKLNADQMAAALSRYKDLIAQLQDIFGKIESLGWTPEHLADQLAEYEKKWDTPLLEDGKPALKWADTEMLEVLGAELDRLLVESVEAAGMPG